MGGQYTRAMFCHQFDFLKRMGLTTVEGIATDLSEAGYDALWVKSHDGLDFMAAFDSSPLAVGSLDDLKRLVDDFGVHGIAVMPWCVPTGVDPVGEARLAAQVANVAGVIIPDVEPYKGFWNVALRSAGGIVPYIDALRNAAPDATVHISMHSSQYAHGALRTWEWLPMINGDVCSQSYWTDFQSDPRSTLSWDYGLLSVYGRPWRPTFPGNGTLESYREAERYLANLASRGYAVDRYSVWVYSGTSQATRRSAGSVKVVELKQADIALERKNLHSILYGYAAEMPQRRKAVERLLTILNEYQLDFPAELEDVDTGDDDATHYGNILANLTGYLAERAELERNLTRITDIIGQARGLADSLRLVIANQ